jgi:hypothetical protein
MRWTGKPVSRSGWFALVTIAVYLGFLVALWVWG